MPFENSETFEARSFGNNLSKLQNSGLGHTRGLPSKKADSELIYTFSSYFPICCHGGSVLWRRALSPEYILLLSCLMLPCFHDFHCSVSHYSDDSIPIIVILNFSWKRIVYWLRFQSMLCVIAASHFVWIDSHLAGLSVTIIVIGLSCLSDR